MKTANAHAGTNTWTLRLFTFFVWAAVGLCAAYWAYKFVTTQAVAATTAIAQPAVVVDTKAVAKLLGATDTIAAKSTNTLASVKLTLFGLATTRNGSGYALIAIEDKPAKPYRVGAQVTDDLVLKSISKVDAVLAASSTAPDGQKLELPTRKPATFIASSTTAPAPSIAQTPAPSLIPPVINAAGTAGASSSVLIDGLRPTSRFAPRPAGTPGAPVVPAMPVPATGSAVTPALINPASTINPAAAASSAVGATPDGAAR